MALAPTLALAGLALALTVLFGWLGARPSRPGQVRLTPWRFLMLLAFTGFIAAGVHVSALLRGQG